MRGWARWVGASAAAVGLPVGAAAPAGAGGGRIAGSFAGDGELVNDPCALPEVPDTVGIGVEFTAHGRLASLGRAEVEGTLCLDPRDGRPFGPLTLSGRRGTVTGGIDGQRVESPDLNPSTFDLDYTVTGGTGRYAGATGTLEVELTVDIAHFPVQVEGTIDGRVR